MKRLLLRLLSPRRSLPSGKAWLKRLAEGEAATMEEDVRAGWELARALHGPPSPSPGLGRREEASVHAARRRRADELAEAIHGLPYPAALRLGERLEPRPDLDRAGLAAAARRIARNAPEREMALSALSLLGIAPGDGDLPLLLEVARSAPGAPAAARVASALPSPRPALLAIVGAASGLGRALAMEELLRTQAPEEDLPALLAWMAAIDDPLERAWASVPLLEALGDPSALLASHPDREEALVRGIEANARGGWRGGPGPGLGRLLGAQRVAVQILREGRDEALRERVARAAVEAHPSPSTELLRLANELLSG